MDPFKRQCIELGKEWKGCAPEEKNALGAILREELELAIPRSVTKLSERNGGGPLLGYSLYVDGDLFSVLAAGFTEQNLAAFERATDRWSPPEWRELGVEDPLNDASRLLCCLSRAHYRDEGDDLGPDDDHLRPWKEALFGELVEALRVHRGGVFGHPDCFLVVQYPDPSDAMERWIDEGVRRLNPDSIYAGWRNG